MSENWSSNSFYIIIFLNNPNQSIYMSSNGSYQNNWGIWNIWYGPVTKANVVGTGWW